MNDTALDTYRLFDGSTMETLERPQGTGDPLVMRFRLKHDCGAPPPHVHPHATEVFEVLEGEFELMVEDEWKAVRAGESVTVEPGVRHTFRNQSGSEVVVRNVHDPHRDFEAYIRSIAELSQKLETVSPSGPGEAARMAVLWQRHSDLIRPADPPLRVAMPVLAGAARLLRLDVPA